MRVVPVDGAKSGGVCSERARRGTGAARGVSGTVEDPEEESVNDTTLRQFVGQAITSAHGLVEDLCRDGQFGERASSYQPIFESEQPWHECNWCTKNSTWRVDVKRL